MKALINHPFKTTAVIALALVIPAGATLAQGSDGSALSGAQRTVIRDATEQFSDVDNAIAAGYVASDECVELPGVGGMGYHFVNQALAGDAKVDPTMPEALVYNRTAQGRLRLDAVEWFVVDADQNLATDADRPTLMGHAFDGPMPGHGPGAPVHYDLHTWVFTHNPAGELSPWNPKVDCD